MPQKDILISSALSRTNTKVIVSHYGVSVIQPLLWKESPKRDFYTAYLPISLLQQTDTWLSKLLILQTPGRFSI